MILVGFSAPDKGSQKALVRILGFRVFRVWGFVGLEFQGL